MAFFAPSFRFHRVEEITPAFLQSQGVRGLLLDVDNTLSPHNAPLPEPMAVRWLKKMQRAGVAVMIVSNNRPARVSPFAARLGLPFTANAAKPLPLGFDRARRTLGLPRESLAVVGDQLFTDMAGANAAHLRAILVDPIQPETHGFLRVKRKWERPLLPRYPYTEIQKKEADPQ